MELSAFDQALRQEQGAFEFAVVECGTTSGVRDFGDSIPDLASNLNAILEESKPCPPGADLVDRAIDELAWKEGAEKRIVIVARFGQFGMNQRATAEESVHRAERAGIVLHAIEFFEPDAYAKPMSSLASDVHRFLDRPTLPLGRAPSLTRHATLMSGGSYFIGPFGPFDARHYCPPIRSRMKKQFLRSFLPELERLAATKEAYADGSASHDGLDDIADGRRLPRDVSADELPAKLRNIDLEPLLDAVWDYVDARRTVAQLLREATELVEHPDSGGRIGVELARAVIAPRRLPPSRR